MSWLAKTPHMLINKCVIHWAIFNQHVLASRICSMDIGYHIQDFILFPDNVHGDGGKEDTSMYFQANWGQLYFLYRVFIVQNWAYVNRY